MRIEKNVSIYVGNSSAEQTDGKKAEERKSIFAGEFQKDTLQNRIENRRNQAREQAFKVVSDVWDGDRAIDADLKNRRDHIKALDAENKDLRQKIGELSEAQSSLQDKYHVEDGSKEQQDLELLRRVKSGNCTMEERKQAAVIKQGGLTEYQEHMLSLDDSIKEYRDIVDKNDMQIEQENAIIRVTKLERLKHSPMVKAEKQAEEIMDAAGKEIIGMVVEDAKEHIDEENEKRKEQAEEIKEERKAQEELLEKRAERKKEQEELPENMPMEELLSAKQSQVNVQKEVQEIVDKMKLVAEDIKGAKVDREV